MLPITIALMLSLALPAQDGRLESERITVRRGTIEHSDHLSQMLKIRLEGNGGTRYYYVHPYVRITLDGKPSGLVFLKEKMAVDLHVLELENAQMVIRVTGYYRTNGPPMARVPSGPFDDTAKIVKFYPRPDPAMMFRIDEALRMAVPTQYLVPLARSENEMSATWDKFEKAVTDPGFSIAEPWPIAIVPLGTKAKVLRVTEIAYEVEVTGGRYDHWHLFMKKEWAYPADETQAAKKADEMAAAKPKADAKKPAVAEANRPRNDDEDRRAKEAEEKLAGEKLDQAKTLLRANQREQAVEKLERLVIEHPDTRAAGEAKKLLRENKR